jgi:hypothetical protein
MIRTIRAGNTTVTNAEQMTAPRAKNIYNIITRLERRDALTLV